MRGYGSMRFQTLAGRGFQSRHNLRYWERRPYLGLGLDASSMLRRANGGQERNVLRATTTDDLKAYLAAPEAAETAWLSLEQQHEEAWFLGLRLNAGVKLAEMRNEFGNEPVTRALLAVARLSDGGLLTSDGNVVRLTARGRLLSNDVFQEFLGLLVERDEAIRETLV